MCVVCVCTGASDVESPSDCCFTAGEREVICNVTVVRDGISESDEIFIIRLDPDDGEYVCEAPGAPNITVTISEGPPDGMLLPYMYICIIVSFIHLRTCSRDPASYDLYYTARLQYLDAIIINQLHWGVDHCV